MSLVCKERHISLAIVDGEKSGAKLVQMEGGDSPQILPGDGVVDITAIAGMSDQIESLKKQIGLNGLFLLSTGLSGMELLW